MSKPGDINPTPIAERPFEHTARNGIRFTSNRCDFRADVVIEMPKEATEREIVSATAEMIGYHATNVLDQLRSGFQGYDCLIFDIRRS